MLLELMQTLKRVGITRVAWILCVFLGVYAWLTTKNLEIERKRLETAETALKNPKVVERVRYVRVKLPVRVITKIVQKPSGEKETTIDKQGFGESVFVGDDKEVSPVDVVALAKLLTPEAQSDRWLLGVSHRDWTPGLWDHYGLWGGYSFRNRVDVLGGLTYHVRPEANLMLVFRF